MTKLIFINYRRTDSKEAAFRLRNLLDELLIDAEVFIDGRSIEAGDNWEEHINNKLRSADLFIAVIGPNWLKAENTHGRRRLDFENDWVRKEIEFAIASNIAIVPILVSDAKFPLHNALPASLQPLVDYQSCSLRTSFFEEDVDLLVKGLEKQGFKRRILEQAVLNNNDVDLDSNNVEPNFVNFIPQGLSNDIAEGPDYLNIKNEVEALAEILVMKNLEAPLAVGIFGGWGSGKSYVMHLIQEKITEIRCQPLKEEQAWKNDAQYVGHIYQIRFDAWTYTRSNLWASLMQNIFFELNRQLTLEKQLQKAGVPPLSGGLIWKALNEMSDEERQILLEYQLDPEELKTWENIVEQKQIEDLLLDNLKKSKQEQVDILKKKEIVLQKERTKLQELKDNIHLEVKNEETIFASPIVKSLIKNVIDLAPNEFKQKFVKFNKIIKLSQEDISEIKRNLEDLRSNELFTLRVLKKWILSHWKLILGFSIFALLTILAPIIISRITELLIPQVIATLLPLIPTIVTANDLFKKFQNKVKKFKYYQEELEKYEKENQKNQAKKIEEKLSQSNEVQASKTNIKQLEAQIKQQKQIVDIVNYVSLADFVTDQIKIGQYEKRLGLLHQIKNDLAELTQKLTLPKELGQRYQQKKEQLKELFPRGKARVILYIDDLDRCPPKRVVEVLEAVQLLLKTSLFVVVLAIDDRYIARALEKIYEGVLKRGGKPSGIDYLEKIIQIPYRLRPISPSAMEYYLRSHMEIEEDKSIRHEEEKEKINNAEEGIQEKEKFSTRKPENNQTTTVEFKDVSSKESEELPSQIIKFTDEEFRTLKYCCQQVELSPRTAKRLINIYKILKIIWFRLQQQKKYKVSQDVKKTIIACLSLSERYPNFMRNVFAEIETYFEEEEVQDVRFIEIFRKEQDLSNDIHSQREWNKFLNDVKKLIPSNIELEKLKQENFSIMFSFCFVGDIGYDPNDFVSINGKI